MEFITDEVATSLNLSKEQIDGIKPLYETQLATEKQAWDGKANTDAENILSGVVNDVKKTFGVELDREQGEKYAAYLQRLSHKANEVKVTELSALKTDYDKKLKEVGNGDATAKELAETKRLYDEALQKYADYDDQKATAEKYAPLEKEHLTLKEGFALNAVKPTVPETVNKYEFDAKWNEFVSKVKESNKIEIIDNIGYAIDNDNPHKKTKLSDLVTQDANLTALMQGRTQQGSGTQPANKDIDGVPFAVPENATSEEVSKLINEQLDRENIPKADKSRAKKFAEYHNAIKSAKK